MDQRDQELCYPSQSHRKGRGLGQGAEQCLVLEGGTGKVDGRR